MLHKCTPVLAAMGLFVCLRPVAASLTEEDLDNARRCFAEAKALSDKEGGRLWGRPLYGPMILVEPQSRQVVANQSDEHGILRQRGEVFLGKLPAEIMIANTATTWERVKWTMILWPLPADRRDRERLMAHELWHRIQDDLGFPGSNPANAHLDSPDGRAWLRLEWRALASALKEGTKASQHSAVHDALVFRAYRRSLYPAAAAEERGLEMNEGLAEYTGIRAAADDKTLDFAARNLERGEQAATFVRSFAYASGPAYGLLLDRFKPTWRSEVDSTSDLGLILQAALDVELPGSDKLSQEATKRAERYNGSNILAQEAKRHRDKQKVLSAYRAKFVEGRVLRLPFVKMHIEFNPNNLVPLDDAGTVYPTMRISDAWGVLTVTGGGMVDAQWRFAVVAAPADPTARPLAGDGWQLDLREDWTVRKDTSDGQYRLVRKASTSNP